MKIVIEFIILSLVVGFLIHDMNNFAKGIIGLAVTVWWINSLKNR